MAVKNIAITGASSGLGRALALHYAAPGVSLHLAGRDAARLAGVAREVLGQGAAAVETIVDVTDRGGMAAWVAGCGRLDLVIANAGISGGPGAGNREAAAQIRAVFATNVDGAFNTVLPAIEAGAKHVVIIGSIAGLIALPTSPAYSAAKAALNFWVAAAGPGLARDGIALTLVRPGFIRTPMTAGNPYRMPGLMEAERAAAIIAAGIAAKARFVTFPWWLAAFARLGNLMPKGIFARVPGKPPST
jgi:short-subunit dehydrogenase